jgi:hypothetical protein
VGLVGLVGPLDNLCGVISVVWIWGLPYPPAPYRAYVGTTDSTKERLPLRAFGGSDTRIAPESVFAFTEYEESKLVRLDSGSIDELVLNGLFFLESKLDRELAEDTGRAYNRGGSISGSAPQGRNGGEEE